MSLLRDDIWWEQTDEESLAELVIASVRCVDGDTLDRQQWMLDAYCLYGDRSALAGDGYLEPQADVISRNVIANATDTILSEVTQTRPRPMFVTIGGTWNDQQKARKLTYFMDAKFQEHEVRDLAEQALRDAIICGIGILRPYIDPQKKKVCIERIFPLHFLVDDRNRSTATPRCFYVRHIVDRFHLVALYPEHEKAIEDAPGPNPQQWYHVNYRARDVVEVLEAVHLPSCRSDDFDADDDDDDSEEDDTGTRKKPKYDGRHVYVIPGAVLYDEPYVHDDPPFAVVRAVKPITGYIGESLVQRAASTQAELNKLLRRIQDAMHLHARPIIFMPRQANIPKAHIANRVGAVIMYDGPQPPTQFTPQSMPSDVYSYVNELKMEIFGLMGVSELSARSLKPAGLNSGRAIQNYNDVQSRRMIGAERDFESLPVRLSRLVVRLEKRIAADNPGHAVVYHDKMLDTREMVPWEEIDLDEERYRIQVFPASAFPQDPAAKIEMLEGMLQRGSIDQQAFYELAFDVPDLEAVRNRLVAPLELIHKRLFMMLHTHKYLPVEPYMDLNLALKVCATTVQEAELKDAPEEGCELLRQWMLDCEALLGEAKASDAAAMAAVTPPPPALPMPGGNGMGGPLPPTDFDMTGSPPPIPPPPGLLS